MNTNPTPPPASALYDALALARLALNPAEALKYFEALKEVTERHETAVRANMGKDKDISSREDALREWEAKMNSRESDLKDREVAARAKAEKLERELSEHASGVDVEKDSLAQERAALKAQRESLEHAKRNFEQTSASRTAELNTREADILKREGEHAERLRRLKELTA